MKQVQNLLIRVQYETHSLTDRKEKNQTAFFPETGGRLKKKEAYHTTDNKYGQLVLLPEPEKQAT